MIKPAWPAPTWIRAFTTTRAQGNLLLPAIRQQLCQSVGLENTPAWLHQVHGTTIVQLPTLAREADGAWTQAVGTPCAVLTADCLPLLLTDMAGSIVAAVHCGWRGIAGGIIEHTVQTLQSRAQALMAWLGPAIGPACFEVGSEVRAQFIEKDPAMYQAFLPTPKRDKWMGNLYQLATHILQKQGVFQIYGGDGCTFSQQNLYSYRQGAKERMATVIWRAP